MGVKEHNGDYLPDKILLEHPHLGVTAMNVAPEFGVVETRAYLELAETEARNIEADKCSGLKPRMREAAVRSQRWRKWVLGDMAQAPVETILKDEKLSDEITDICGHYTYEIPEVKAAIGRMMENLRSIGVDGEAYVIYKLKESLDRYAFASDSMALPPSSSRRREPNADGRETKMKRRFPIAAAVAVLCGLLGGCGQEGGSVPEPASSAPDRTDGRTQTTTVPPPRKGRNPCGLSSSGTPTPNTATSQGRWLLSWRNPAVMEAPALSPSAPNRPSRKPTG